MPRSGWLAVGAVAAAVVVDSLTGTPVLPAGLGGAALVVAGSVAVRSGRARLRSAGFMLLGAGILVCRVGLAGGPPAADLPAQSGPWIGSVEALDPPRDGRQRAVLRLEPTSARVLADLPPEPRLDLGDVVRIEGRLRAPPEGPYGDYLRRSGLVATLTARRHERLGHGGGPATVLADLRTAAVEAIARAIPEPEAGLAAGILVGRRDRVDRVVAADFAAAGLSHIVAISGWNIAIVGTAVGAAVRGASRRRRAWLTIAAIVGYVAFVGPSASVVRAAAMALVVLLARLSGRGAQAAGALAVAVVALLLVDPGFATDAGFQLSVAATAGLLRWASPFEEGIERRTGGRLPGWLTETLAVSLAAQLATLPIVVAAFGRISLVAPAANLVVVPLVPVAMGLGAIALLGGLAGSLGVPILATAAGLPAWLTLRVVVETAHLAAGLPFATLAVPEPLAAAVGLTTGAAVVALAARRHPGRGPVRAVGVHGVLGDRAAARSARGAPSAADARSVREPGPSSVRDDPSPGHERPPRGRRRTGGGRRRPRLGLLAIVPLVAAVLAGAYRPAGDPHLVVFDVGQGDAILVEGGRGGRLLVDGGPDPARLLRLLDTRIPPWDRRIDVVVATHPHEDHVGGLPMLLDRYRVGAILTNGMTGPGPSATTLAALLAGEARSTTLAAGDRLAVDGVAFDVLWPLRGTVPSIAPDTGREINDTSIVLLGTAGRHRFLLMGDVEDDVDPVLLSRGLPRVDVLKVAHHGSRTATTPAFLEATRPAVAVVSVGADNPYGHPAPETIARLRAIGARVLRTDEVGTVELIIRPRSIEVSSAAGVEAFGAPASSSGAAEPPRPEAAASSRPAADESRGSDAGGRRAAAVGYDPSDAAPRLGRPDDPSPDSPTVPVGETLGPTSLRSGERRGRRPSTIARHRPADAGRRSSRFPPQGVGDDARSHPDREPGAVGGRGPPRVWRTVTEPGVRGTAPSRRSSTGTNAPPRAALAFFFGDDEYAVEEAATAFGDRVAGPGAPLERWRVAGRDVDLETLVARLGSAPLLGGGTLVLLSEPDRLVASPSPARRRELVDRLLDSVAPGNALAILDLPAPGKKPSAALAALKAGIEARGGVVEEFRTPTMGTMTKWLLDRAAERGIRLEPAAAAELAARVGAFVEAGDVDRRAMARLASSELDKLGHYRGAEPVRVEDVRALVSEAIPASTWAALDAVGERRLRGGAARPGALVLLDRLFEETPRPLLVAQLHRRLRELVEIRSALDAGATVAAIAKARKLHPFRAEVLARQAARWTLPELEAALEGLLALDLRFKNVPPATEAQQRLDLVLWLLERVAQRPSRSTGPTARPGRLTGAAPQPRSRGSRRA